MSNLVTIGLIQASNEAEGSESVAVHKEMAIEKHIKLIRHAAEKGAQIVCLQEIFYGPYFCTEQNAKWYDAAEEIPNGPTTSRFQALARELGIVIVLPIYEREGIATYYNTAAVIDADGSYLGKYRKHHIPQVNVGDSGNGFWEKYYFKPGNLGYPVFDTAFAKVGVYICYDRHFPEGARLLGLNGAEIVFNPSATVAGLSEYLWKLEQPAHAVANGYYIGAINRVGMEGPWNLGEFYGQSYLCDPRGSFVAIGSRDQDEVVIGTMDRELIREVRNTWQFFRDRRPETYQEMTELLP
ncbi:nitrilase-related carbon-nitrogen hydrolase [Fictibacillus enclensis]|uniref:nitrilase-related carbon-nitrogen hydrolase n=1 Tax=Fictibacillus TaxID=1329200 RepID=UPI001012AF71|nr:MULTISPECIES: nitrilase-related carbon-nitrogen hydrolase [Fictibacillus]MDM5338652.1 nitrilase-related carbon-nitrogen hydrolase [Fictibacillus enclensis]RXY98819.1 acyltransferase [Fictibacillus sp. S7]WHY74969.1 nitrilase-related carbon-nitrogen hydrolase [Fictibacillus enclensis]